MPLYLNWIGVSLETADETQSLGDAARSERFQTPGGRLSETVTVCGPGCVDGRDEVIHHDQSRRKERTALSGLGRISQPAIPLSGGVLIPFPRIVRLITVEILIGPIHEGKQIVLLLTHIEAQVIEIDATLPLG